MRWDGTDVRELLRVTGPPAPGGTGTGPSASLILMAPTGDQALAQVNNDLYVVTVPVVGGEAPTDLRGEPGQRRVPGARLTDIGGQFPAWSADGTKVHWSIGNAHVVYDLDARASAFDDSVRAARAARAARRAAGRATRRRGGARHAARAGRRARAALRAVETRIRITAQRDIPRGTAVLRGGARHHDARRRGHRGRGHRRPRQPHRRGGRARQVDVPAGAQVIDVAGRTIVPGFVDTHAHLRPARRAPRPEVWPYAANLAYGVTTTRDPQTGHDRRADLRRHGRDRRDPRPAHLLDRTGRLRRSGEHPRPRPRARVLRRYSDYYDTKTIKQYVAGNREQRQWIIRPRAS
jgi:hypothetical protein